MITPEQVTVSVDNFVRDLIEGILAPHSCEISLRQISTYFITDIKAMHSTISVSATVTHPEV